MLHHSVYVCTFHCSVKLVHFTEYVWKVAELSKPIVIVQKLRKVWSLVRKKVTQLLPQAEQLHQHPPLSVQKAVRWNGKGSNLFDTLKYPRLPASHRGSSISTDPNTVAPVYLIWSHEIIQSFKNIVCRRRGSELFTKQKIFFYLVFPFITNLCEELCHFWHVGRLVYLKCEVITTKSRRKLIPHVFWHCCDATFDRIIW